MTTLLLILATLCLLEAAFFGFLGWARARNERRQHAALEGEPASVIDLGDFIARRRDADKRARAAAQRMARRRADAYGDRKPAA